MERRKTKPTGITEATLFPLEQTHSEKKRRAYPYRGQYQKKEGGSNKRLWMELYPEPKRKTEQQPKEAQGALWHDGILP